MENIFEHLPLPTHLLPSNSAIPPPSPSERTTRGWMASKTLGADRGGGERVGSMQVYEHAKIETTRGVSQFVRMVRNKNNASGGYYDESTLSTVPKKKK